MSKTDFNPFDSVEGKNTAQDPEAQIKQQQIDMAFAKTFNSIEGKAVLQFLDDLMEKEDNETPFGAGNLTEYMFTCVGRRSLTRLLHKMRDRAMKG